MESGPSDYPPAKIRVLLLVLFILVGLALLHFWKMSEAHLNVIVGARLE